MERIKAWIITQYVPKFANINVFTVQFEADNTAFTMTQECFIKTHGPTFCIDRGIYADYMGLEKDYPKMKGFDSRKLELAFQVRNGLKTTNVPEQGCNSIQIPIPYQPNVLIK